MLTTLAMNLNLNLCLLAQVAQPPALAPAPTIAPLPMPAQYNDPATTRDWSRLRARQRLGKRLAAGGFAGFGAAFIANIVGGITSGAFGKDPSGIVGLVPVAGSFVVAAWQDPDAHGLKTLFVLDGLAQAGFLAMGITGAVIAKRSRRALAQPRFSGLHDRLETRLHDPDLLKRGRIGLGLGLGGFGGFGLAYFGSVLSMFSAESKQLLTSDTDVTRAWAILPLAGSFVIAGQADLAGTKALMAILGVVQVGSLATGITGVVMRGRRMRDAESRVLQNIGVTPWHSGTTTGLSIRGQF